MLRRIHCVEAPSHPGFVCAYPQRVAGSRRGAGVEHWGGKGCGALFDNEAQSSFPQLVELAVALTVQILSKAVVCA